MRMKNKILLLTDFSENARNAIFFAIHAFPPEQYDYILLHGYPRIHTTAEVTISLSEKMRVETNDALAREEKTINDQLGTALTFEKIAYLGFLNEAVHYVAEEHKPDLVVMGTKGETGLPAILLGSHASSLIKATHLPLMIIPENARFNGFREVVLAADVETLKRPEHLDVLVELTDNFNSRLTVVNVVAEPGDPLTRIEDAGSELLEHFTDNQVTIDHVVDPRVEHGIAQYVHDHPCDLVVAVEKSRSFIVDLFHRSVSKQLALHAETPLLILHA